MARVSNKQIADVFRAAKKHLYMPGSRCRGDASRYICIAIYDSYYGSGPVPSIYWKAKNIVMQRLSRCISVHTYLREVVKVPEKLLTDKNIQTFRHRWLDSLIEEFDKKK